jgi:hypothetical protein
MLFGSRRSSRQAKSINRLVYAAWSKFLANGRSHWKRARRRITLVLEDKSLPLPIFLSREGGSEGRDGQGAAAMMVTSYPKALGVAAVAYVGVDYLREVAPELHKVLRPLLWGFFAVAAAVRAPYYEYWQREFRAVGLFLGSLVFMLCALCVEALAVQYVTTVLGLDWHW